MDRHTAIVTRYEETYKIPKVNILLRYGMPLIGTRIQGKELQYQELKDINWYKKDPTKIITR